MECEKQRRGLRKITICFFPLIYTVSLPFGERGLNPEAVASITPLSTLVLLCSHTVPGRKSLQLWLQCPLYSPPSGNPISSGPLYSGQHRIFHSKDVGLWEQETFRRLAWAGISLKWLFCLYRQLREQMCFQESALVLSYSDTFF